MFRKLRSLWRVALIRLIRSRDQREVARAAICLGVMTCFILEQDSYKAAHDHYSLKVRCQRAGTWQEEHLSPVSVHLITARARRDVQWELSFSTTN